MIFIFSYVTEWVYQNPYPMCTVSVHVYGHLDTEDADHCAPLRGRGQLGPGRIKRDGGQRGVVSGDHQLGLKQTFN